MACSGDLPLFEAARSRPWRGSKTSYREPNGAFFSDDYLDEIKKIVSDNFEIFTYFIVKA